MLHICAQSWRLLSRVLRSFLVPCCVCTYQNIVFWQRSNRPLEQEKGLRGGTGGGAEEQEAGQRTVMLRDWGAL